VPAKGSVLIKRSAFISCARCCILSNPLPFFTAVFSNPQPSSFILSLHSPFCCTTLMVRLRAEEYLTALLIASLQINILTYFHRQLLFYYIRVFFYMHLYILRCRHRNCIFLQTLYNFFQFIMHRVYGPYDII
jgi:hypothetical protein